MKNFLLGGENFFFFFNDTATTEIYTLSLHDALPISTPVGPIKINEPIGRRGLRICVRERRTAFARDRKSTRLNSSHGYISYAVFCLKKKKFQHAVLSANRTPDGAHDNRFCHLESAEC